VARSGAHFCRLGMSPLCETIRRPPTSPWGGLLSAPCLHLRTLLLVQLEQYESPSTSSATMPYFSSYSDSWLKHAEQYCDTMMTRLRLGAESFVVEVASNDGYLLQYFVQRNVPVLASSPQRMLPRWRSTKACQHWCGFRRATARALAAKTAAPTCARQ